MIVHRGPEEYLCAGAIAEVFKNLGGEVIYFGKPHREVYDLCLEKIKKTLIIGDNLNTDIKGANNLNLDHFFITSGIHRLECKEESKLEDLFKKYQVKVKYYQKNLSW